MAYASFFQWVKPRPQAAEQIAVHIDSTSARVQQPVRCFIVWYNYAFSKSISAFKFELFAFFSWVNKWLFVSVSYCDVYNRTLSTPPSTRAPSNNHYIFMIIYSRHVFFIYLFILFFRLKAHFRLEMLSKEANPKEIRGEIISPSGRVECRLTWNGIHGKGTFVPTEVGMHKVHTYTRSIYNFATTNSWRY